MFLNASRLVADRATCADHGFTSMRPAMESVALKTAIACWLALLAAMPWNTAQAQSTQSDTAASAQASVFAQMFPRPLTSIGQSATLLPEGRWLLIGGQATKQFKPSASAVVLDPANGRGTPLAAEMRQARAGHTANLLPDGSILILGGVNERGQIADPERWDPASGKFSSAGRLGLIPRSQHAATLLADGRLLITGG